MVDAPPLLELRPMERRDAVVSAMVGLLALGVFLLNDNHVRIGDTFPARILPISILEEGDLDFNEFQVLVGDGHRLEESYQFNRVGDRILSYYSIVPGLINVPAHVVARGMGLDSVTYAQPLARITAAGVAGLSVFFMTWTLTGLCQRRSTAILFGLVYAFGTTTFSVASTALWQHGPSLLFLTAALCGLVSKRRFGYAAAGLMLGMAVWNRIPNVGYALALTAYVALEHRRGLPWLIGGALLPAVLLFTYSWTHWGSFFALGEGHQVALLSGPFWPNLMGILVSPNRGLFVFTPVFLLALPLLGRVVVAPRRAPLLFALALGALMIVVVHALWSYWWGGESFGYRLLTETVPFWIVLLALSWERWIARYRSAVAGFAVLSLVSVYFHTLGALYYPSGWNTTPRSIDDDPERAWDLRDTELARLHRVLWAGESDAGALPPR